MTNGIKDKFEQTELIHLELLIQVKYRYKSSINLNKKYPGRCNKIKPH